MVWGVLRLKLVFGRLLPLGLSTSCCLANCLLLSCLNSIVILNISSLEMAVMEVAEGPWSVSLL